MTPAEELRKHYTELIAARGFNTRLLLREGMRHPPDLLPKINASGQYRTSGRLPGVLWTLNTSASWFTTGVQWSVTLNYLKGRGHRHYTDFAASLAEANAAGLAVIEHFAAHPPKRGRERWIPRGVIGRSRRRRAVLRAMQSARRVERKYVKPAYEMKNQESQGTP